MTINGKQGKDLEGYADLLSNKTYTYNGKVYKLLDIVHAQDFAGYLVEGENFPKWGFEDRPPYSVITNNLYFFSYTFMGNLKEVV